MSVRGLDHWLTTPPDEGEGAAFEKDVDEENLAIAHELGACGGDCPDCQRERLEQRDAEYPGEELDIP